MKSKLLLITTLTLLTLPQSAFAAECTIEAIESRVASSDSLYSFEQSKTVQFLSQPLRSSGLIWVSPEANLVWQVLTPIKSTTLIGANGFMEFNRNDEPQPYIDIDVAQEISAIFLSLLSGNFAELDNLFEQNFHCEEENWQLTLNPGNSRIAEILNSLTLTGRESIIKIEYEESRGDQTQIHTYLETDDISSKIAGLEPFIEAYCNANPKC